MDSGQFAVSGLAYYAGIGGIAESNTIDSGIITQTQMDAYNSALGNVQSATYYNAQMFFEDQAEVALEQMSLSVNDFVDATSAMSQVITIFSMASEAATTETQLALQSYITDNSLSITQGQVLEYNDSLESVQTYSQMAAAFIQASQNDFVTQTVDQQSQDFNVSLLETTATYTQSTDNLQLTWNNTNQSLGFFNFFQNDMKSSLDVMGVGQSIYEGNTL
tara:strand:+ start:13967 stop:14626 length:660 start_codon:yes stop_codon:yes gene_type:complete